MRPSIKPVIGAAFCVAIAMAGQTADALDVRLETTAGDDLKQRLTDASRLIAAQAEGTTNPQDIMAIARSEYRRLIGTLYGRGHYSGVVHIYIDGREAASIPPLSVPAQINDVRITVTPGRAFTFGREQVAPLNAGTELPEGFARGEPARSGLVGDAGRAAVSGWRRDGHAKARISGQKITADHPNRSLDVALAVDPGPEVIFGQMITTPETNVRPSRIRAIAHLPTGEKFDPDTVEQIGRRLRRTGTFRSVTVEEAETLGPDNSLDITATLIEEKPRRFGFGGEVSSFEGATISTYFIHRNLFRGAERLRLDAEVSGIGGDSGGIDYSLSARITRPATLWPDTSAYILGSAELEDEPSYYSQTAKASIGLESIISEELEASVSAGYRFSDVRDDIGSRRFRHLTLSAGAEWDRRDDALNPGKGFYLAADAMPFIGLAGSATGAQIKADGRAYRRLGGDDGRIVLAGRLQFGSIVGAPLAETPPDLLFYSGGGGTVRGHPYQSLNVDLGGGAETGGRAFVGTSAEVRAGITEKIGLVGFVDAGWIDAASLPSGSSQMHAGAGLGLRYNTGIGPIRLDVAAPIAGDTGNGVQIYVGIGQSF